MRNAVGTLFVTVALTVSAGATGRAHEKPLPPAFEKEIVKEGSVGKSGGAGEREDLLEEEQEERAKLQHARRPHREAPLKGAGHLRLDPDDED